MTGIRASDEERDRAAGELRERFAEGRLSQETFLYRLDRALRAKDSAELSGLLGDLPPRRQGWLAGGRPGRGWLGWAARIAGRWRPGPGAAGYSAARHDQFLPPFYLPRQANGRFTIGRAMACDFTLADLSVSRWHAKLHKDGEAWLLSDLGSTNGTRLNGWRVTTGVPLRPGDRVTFGSVSFIVRDVPAALG